VRENTGYKRWIVPVGAFCFLIIVISLRIGHIFV
jgi:hypothetical protein